MISVCVRTDTEFIIMNHGCAQAERVGKKRHYHEASRLLNWYECMYLSLKEWILREHWTTMKGYVTERWTRGDPTVFGNWQIVKRRKEKRGCVSSSLVIPRVSDDDCTNERREKLEWRRILGGHHVMVMVIMERKARWWVNNVFLNPRRIIFWERCNVHLFITFTRPTNYIIYEWLGEERERRRERNAQHVWFCSKWSMGLACHAVILIFDDNAIITVAINL